MVIKPQMQQVHVIGRNVVINHDFFPKREKYVLSYFQEGTAIKMELFGFGFVFF